MLRLEKGNPLYLYLSRRSYIDHAVLGIDWSRHKFLAPVTTNFMLRFGSAGGCAIVDWG